MAERAREALGLERVLLVPARVQPLKTGDALSPPEDRLAMLRLAVAGNPALEVCELELRREGPSYTADTLAELSLLHPGAEWVLILGADAFEQLNRWRRHEDVKRMARIAVVSRPGWPDRGATSPPAQAAVGSAAPVLALEVPALAISASDIRARVAGGASIRYLVPEPVREYIVARGLYRE